MRIIPVIFCLLFGVLLIMSLAWAADCPAAQCLASCTTGTPTGQTCPGTGLVCCPVATSTNCTGTCRPSCAATGETQDTTKTCPTSGQVCCVTGSGTGSGSATGGSAVPQTGGTVQLTNPLTGVPEGTSGVAVLIGRVIGLILGVTGSFALLMFVYGGFTMITSAGHTDAIKKGKDILIWAVLGLAVILGSYLLVSYVVNGIVSGVGAGVSGGSTSGGDKSCTDWGGTCTDVGPCGSSSSISDCIQQYMTTHSVSCVTGKCLASGQSATVVCCKPKSK